MPKGSGIEEYKRPGQAHTHARGTRAPEGGERNQETNPVWVQTNLKSGFPAKKPKRASFSRLKLALFGFLAGNPVVKFRLFITKGKAERGAGCLGLWPMGLFASFRGG